MADVRGASCEVFLARAKASLSEVVAVVPLLYKMRDVRSMEPAAGSSGKILAIHFWTRGWRKIWLRLNGFQRRNDHVPGAIFLKWEARP